MRYFAIVLLILSGCATSEYGRGCRDGVDGLYFGEYKEWQNDYCDKLEQKYREEQQARADAKAFNRGKQ